MHDVKGRRFDCMSIRTFLESCTDRMRNHSLHVQILVPLCINQLLNYSTSKNIMHYIKNIDIHRGP